jgi:cell division protein FtsZ
MFIESVEPLKERDFPSSELTDDVQEAVSSELEEEEVPQAAISFDWEVRNEITEEVKFEKLSEQEEKEEEKVTRYILEDDLEAKVMDEEVVDSSLSPEEQQRKAEERMMRIREYTSKLKKPDGIAELEQEPAFMRRKISLDDTPHSSD